MPDGKKLAKVIGSGTSELHFQNQGYKEEAEMKARPR
jgi:hypothetical protein